MVSCLASGGYVLRCQRMCNHAGAPHSHAWGAQPDFNLRCSGLHGGLRPEGSFSVMRHNSDADMQALAEISPGLHVRDVQSCRSLGSHLTFHYVQVWPWGCCRACVCQQQAGPDAAEQSLACGAPAAHAHTVWDQSTQAANPLHAPPPLCLPSLPCCSWQHANPEVLLLRGFVTS